MVGHHRRRPQAQCLRSVGLHGWRIHGFIETLNTLPRARLVGVQILLCRVGVPDADFGNIHRICMAGRNVSLTSSPCYRSRVLGWISTIPQTQTDFHRSLRVLRTIPVRVSCVESPHSFSIDRPDKSLRRPVNSICVESRLRRRNRRCRRAIVSPSVSFAEVVGLHRVRNSAAKLPVDFIEVIG